MTLREAVMKDVQKREQEQEKQDQKERNKVVKLMRRYNIPIEHVSRHSTKEMILEGIVFRLEKKWDYDGGTWDVLHARKQGESCGYIIHRPADLKYLLK